MLKYKFKTPHSLIHIIYRTSCVLQDDEKKDELSSRPSDGETTDDDGDSSVLTLGNLGVSAFSESIPSSPLSHW